MKKKRKKKEGKNKKVHKPTADELLDIASVGIEDIRCNFTQFAAEFDQLKRDVGWLIDLGKDIDKHFEGKELVE